MTNLQIPGEGANSRIQGVIQKLRSACQQDWMGEWRWASGEPAVLDGSGKVVWAKGGQAIELVTQIDLAGWRELAGSDERAWVVRLGLTWWAQRAQVWVDDRLVQEGDLFDHTCRVVLREGWTGEGCLVAVRLKLVSPGHDIGALMRSRLILEQADGSVDAGFVADEVEVVSRFLTAFYPDELVDLVDRLEGLDDGLNELSQIRSVLLHWSDRIQQYKIQCLGHAHLDLAWLWTVDETWEVAERTFVSALNLMKDFPALIFGHTTPVLYEWFEQNRPEIFQAIQERVAAGQWEAIGGLWVEPEMNLIGGESIARQILYGQRYYEAKLGGASRVAWLPDTFGFCGQLPQFLKLGGMDYFVTQKLRWNDTTKYPHEVFQWEATDGTQVLALMSAPIGEWVEPVKMSDYCWEFARRSGCKTALYLPGVGDHGGGPTRDMLEIAQRWGRSAVFPAIEFTTAERFLDALHPAKQPVRVLDETHPAKQPAGANGVRPVRQDVLENQDVNQQDMDGRLANRVNTVDPDQGALPIPIHHGEIYLEFHRGCYTTHADQKAFNRDCENALYEAELWSSLAAFTIGFNYPKKELEQAWKKTLFNQFHDILPGTSIQAVYPTANRAWEEVLIDTECLINNAKDRIISAIAPIESPHPEARLIIVFNSNHWTRSQLIGFVIPDSPISPIASNWQLQTIAGHPIETTVKLKPTGDRHACIIRAIVPDVPPLGYACYWAVPLEANPVVKPIGQAIEKSNQYRLENEFLSVEVSPETGNIQQIFDRKNQREVLSQDGNELLSFTDEGQYWDAWNIDPKYQENPLPPAKLQSISILEQTNLRSRIEVVRTIGRSTFTQTYVLTQKSPIVEIQNYIDWQEKHVFVKAAFPFNLEAKWVTYEAACGMVDRTTHPETEAERAMWEVPGLRWASLSDGDYGVSLLCDRKHGYDHTANTIRLSLLRAPEFPDPIADQGIHEFTIGIYPHAGNWKTADTPKRAVELSLPMQAIVPNERFMQGTLPSSASLLELQAENLMLMAIKQSEDDRKKYILRGYEYRGEAGEIAIGNTGEIAMGMQLGDRLDLLERPLEGRSEAIAPWEIVSFELRV